METLVVFRIYAVLAEKSIKLITEWTKFVDEELKLLIKCFPATWPETFFKKIKPQIISINLKGFNTLIDKFVCELTIEQTQVIWFLYDFSLDFLFYFSIFSQGHAVKSLGKCLFHD